MKYYIKILFELEKKNIINIVIDILCLSLGLLIGLVFMSQASSAYEDIKLDQKYMPLHDYMVCKPAVESQRILQNELNDVKMHNGIGDIQVFNKMNDEVVWYKDSFCPSIGIVAVTEGYFNIFGGDYLLGDDITDIQSAVIGKDVAEKHNICIGDEIEITNHCFQVKGILQIPQYKENVFVLADAFEEIEFYDCRYYVNMQGGDKITFLQYLERNYGAYEVYTAGEHAVLQKDRLKSGWLFSIVIAIMTLCYGLINIFNIEKFFILKQKKIIAILRALGASKRKIVLTKLLRSVIIAWISASVTALFVLFLENTSFGKLIDFHITFMVYVISFLMIAVIYILFSLVLYWQHYNREISKIISEI